MAAQYVNLLSQEPVMPLNADPFNGDEKTGDQHAGKASWVADNLTMFSGAAWDFSQDGKPADWAPGLYALYADVDIQVWHAALIQHTYNRHADVVFTLSWGIVARCNATNFLGLWLCRSMGGSAKMVCCWAPACSLSMCG